MSYRFFDVRECVSVLLACIIVVTPVHHLLATGTGQSPYGQYCHLIRSATTNDTSSCMKNANGTAGCTGDIKEYAKEGECRDATYSIFCNYTCNPTEVDEYVIFNVVPESTFMGQLACFTNLGLTAAGAICILLALDMEVGTSALATNLVASIIFACGAEAATFFTYWLNNPCCHTSCVRHGSSTPGGRRIITC